MELVKFESTEEVGLITINRPDALNALNQQILMELRKVFQSVDLKKTRTLIITGAGERAFAAGADIKEMQSFTRKQAEQYSERGNRIFLEIERFPIPVIAAVNGYALGGGCELAMCCDIRICSDRAKFGMPETGLGIIPGFGGTQRLQGIIGSGMAKELIYTAGMISAQKAYEIGLVNSVYGHHELMEEAKKMAAVIAGNAPIAIRNAKEAMNQESVEASLFGTCFETADQQNRMLRFLEKQKGEAK